MSSARSSNCRRTSAAQLDALKISLGSYRYAGQFQQRPSPAEGGILKRAWFRFWRPAHIDLPAVSVRLPDGSVIQIQAVPIPANFDTMIQSWDMAFKDNVTSDYVVGQVWGAKGADRFLLDQHRARLDMPATKDAVLSLSHRWPKATAKLVEDKANGPAVIQELKHRELPASLHDVARGELIRSVLRRRTDDATTNPCHTR